MFILDRFDLLILFFNNVVENSYDTSKNKLHGSNNNDYSSFSKNIFNGSETYVVRIFYFHFHFLW